jgi:F0F1-type ATP synthase membrane subunit b/b'
MNPRAVSSLQRPNKTQSLETIMEPILTNLHLDLTAFVWHSVNFVLLTAALWWLLFRPLTRLIEDRKAHIDESLVRAAEVERRATAAEAERQALIAGAHREASEIRQRAHEQVQRYVTRSRASASADADRIRQRATVRHGSAETESAPANAQHVKERLRIPRVTHHRNLGGGATVKAAPPRRTRGDY